MVQIENEYGSYYACDFVYTAWLRDTIRKYLVEDVVLFTTDNGNTSLKCGKIAEVYATVDFGVTVDPIQAFAEQRRHEEFGPLVNSEFYPGWMDYWGFKHEHIDTEVVATRLDQILSMNASVNV